jgi:hypothetical protein
MTISRIVPTPPDGAYPQLRLCDQRGKTPSSAIISSTINAVPIIGCSLLYPASSKSFGSPIPADCCLSAFKHAGAKLVLLHRLNVQSVRVDIDGDTIARIPTVVQVIAVARVVNVDIIVVVPVVGPIFRPGLGEAEPEATILETGVSADDHNGVTVNAEVVIGAKVAVIAVFGNAVTVVPSALLPIAMFGLPVVRAMLLPDSLLLAFLAVLLLLGLHVDLPHTSLLIRVLLLLPPGLLL